METIITNCTNCPAHILISRCTGIGSVAPDIMVVSDYLYKSYFDSFYNFLKESYKNITSKDFSENGYFTTIVKCYDTTDYKISQEAIKHCKWKLINEITKINPKKIIYLYRDTTSIIEIWRDLLPYIHIEVKPIQAPYYKMIADCHKNNNYTNEYIKQLNKFTTNLKQVI